MDVTGLPRGNIKIGETDIDAIYLGSNKIWPRQATLELSLEGKQIKDNKKVTIYVDVTCDQDWTYTSAMVSGDITGCSVTRSGNRLTVNMEMYEGTKNTNREFKITVTTEDGTASKWVSFQQDASYFICTPNAIGQIDNPAVNSDLVTVDTNLNWDVTNVVIHNPTTTPLVEQIAKNGNKVRVILNAYEGGKTQRRNAVFIISSTDDIVIEKSYGISQLASYIAFVGTPVTSIPSDAVTNMVIATVDTNVADWELQVIFADTGLSLSKSGNNVLLTATENTSLTASRRIVYNCWANNPAAHVAEECVQQKKVPECSLNPNSVGLSWSGQEEAHVALVDPSGSGAIITNVSSNISYSVTMDANNKGFTIKPASVNTTTSARERTVTVTLSTGQELTLAYTQYAAPTSGIYLIPDVVYKNNSSGSYTVRLYGFGPQSDISISSIGTKSGSITSATFSGKVVTVNYSGLSSSNRGSVVINLSNSMALQSYLYYG